MASSSWWTRLKENVGLHEEEPEPPTLLQQLDEATTLSRTQVLHRTHDLDHQAPLLETVSSGGALNLKPYVDLR